MANRDTSSYSLANRKREAIAAAKAAGVAPPSWAVEPSVPAPAPPAAPAPTSPASPAPVPTTAPPSTPAVSAIVPKAAPPADPILSVASSRSEIVETDDGLTPASAARSRNLPAAAASRRRPTRSASIAARFTAGCARTPPSAPPSMPGRPRRWIPWALSS